MAKLICTLRSTFPQVQPDIFKCSNCGCEEVRPHWKFCCNCGEQLTEIFYPSDKKEVRNDSGYNQAIKDITKYVQDEKKYYTDGTMCSMSESIIGENVCDDILKYLKDKKGGTDCMDEDAKQASIPYTYNAPQHDWKCGYPDITRDKGDAEE